jgi:hypothetical protein
VSGVWVQRRGVSISAAFWQSEGGQMLVGIAQNIIL